MFGLWLDFGEDWDRVQCEVERRAESTNLARSEWVAVQAKTLKAGMEQSKFDELIKKRIDAGLYYQDLDFPSDPMDWGSQMFIVNGFVKQSSKVYKYLMNFRGSSNII